ncbi:hypothetical protein [Massilia sp. DD77]|uniref:hypothetical protein n=1 Tax=Massilia sp. DD77 TaxID=3109349 RepID=UPI003000D75C
MRFFYIFAHIGVALLFAATGATVNRELFGAQYSGLIGSILFFILIASGCIYIFRPHVGLGRGALFYAWGIIFLLYTLIGFALRFASGVDLSISPLALIAGGVLLLSASCRKHQAR